MRITPSLLVPAALALAFVAPAARAGGAHARLEGPSKDGVVYVLRTYNCGQPGAMKVRASAEGVVDGARRSIPLAVVAGDRPGVYTLRRSWPGRGTWVLRIALGGPRSPVTIARLDANGRVADQDLHWGAEAAQACDAALAAAGPR